MFEVEFTNPKTGVEAKYWDIKTVLFDLQEGVCRVELFGKIKKDKDYATQLSFVADKKNIDVASGLPQIVEHAERVVKKIMQEKRGSNEETDI